MAFLRARKGEPIFVPSARFIYYNARWFEGTTKIDSGAEIRNAVKGVTKYGVCSDSWCPYDVKALTKPPRPLAYVNAWGDTLDSYERIHDERRLNDLKACVYDDIPVVFGFSVYEHFESEEIWKHPENRGLMRRPVKGEKVVGGHAVWILAYDDNKQIHDEKGGFLIRNSWAEDWGLKGNFWMPYSLIDDPNFADDFWALRAIN